MSIAPPDIATTIATSAALTRGHYGRWDGACRPDLIDFLYRRYAAESGRTNGVSGRGIAGSLVDVAVLHQEPKPLAELSRDLTRFLVVDMLCSAKRLLPR
jgi:hypothetical protein